MNRWIHRILVVGVSGLGIVTVLGLFARGFALAAMAISFQHLWMVAGLGLAIGWGFRKRWMIAGLCLLLVGFHATHVLPVYWPPDENFSAEATGGERVRIITLNLKGRNKKHNAIRRLVEQRKPDLLLTQETFSEWRKALDPMLVEALPNRLIKRHFGVFSEWPISNVRFVPIENSKRPLLLFDWEHPAGKITVVCMHATTPRFGSWSQRNRELEALATIVADLKTPIIVAGDLNTSLWDPAFKDLLSASEMQHARQGEGIHISFSKLDYYLRLPLPWSFTGAPIDHILYSPDIRCKNAGVVRGIGSDHYPFEADLDLCISETVSPGGMDFPNGSSFQVWPAID